MSRDVDIRPHVERVIAQSRSLAESSLPDSLTYDRAEDALRRDDFRCQQCGSSGWSDGDATLILTYDVPPKRLPPEADPAEVDNLTTVCESCASQMDSIEPIASIPSMESRREHMADSISGFDKFVANHNPKQFVRRAFGDLVVAYIAAVVFGGIIGQVVLGSAGEGAVMAAQLPLLAAVWLPQNYPLVGLVVYFGLLYPVWFLLSEHKPFAHYRAVYSKRQLNYAIVLLAAVTGVLLFPYWLMDYTSLSPPLPLGSPESGNTMLYLGVFAGIQLLIGRVLTRLARADKTETMLRAFMQAELSDYHIKKELTPSDLEGADYYPLVWMFFGRVAILLLIYSAVFLSSSYVWADEIGLITSSAPTVVAIGYIVWRRYQFSSIPTLKFEEGEGVTAEQRRDGYEAGDDPEDSTVTSDESGGVVLGRSDGTYTDDNLETVDEELEMDDDGDVAAREGVDDGDDWDDEFDSADDQDELSSDEQESDGEDSEQSANPFGADELDDGW